MRRCHVATCSLLVICSNAIVTSHIRCHGNVSLSMIGLNRSAVCPSSVSSLSSSRRHGTGRHSSDDTVPDCTHAIAIQMLWTRIPRQDVFPGGDVSGRYPVVVHHGRPGSIQMRKSYAFLRRMSLHAPGIHLVDDNRFGAELHLIHQAEGDAPELTLVLPIDAHANLFQMHSAAVLEWLSKTQYAAPVCSWSAWFWHWRCPRYELNVEDLVRGSEPAVWYRVAQGCTSSTFVVAKPLLAAKEQLEAALRGSGMVVLDNSSRGALRPRDLAVSVALSPAGHFSTFTQEQTRWRNAAFRVAAAVSLLLLLLAFLLVRKRSGTYTTDIAQFALSKSVRYSMIIDHWLSYAMAIALPVTAYQRQSISRQIGMPLEYHACYGLWILLHSFHELFWFSRLGADAKRLDEKTTALYALVGLLTLVDYALDVLFIFVAGELGSFLAYVSASFFVLWLLIELLGFTALTLRAARPEETFKPRGMEVLHGVLLKYSQAQSQQPGTPDTAGINQFGYLLMRVVLQYLPQGCVQIIFVLWVDSCPIVIISAAISLAFALHGFIIALSEVLSWNRVTPALRRGAGPQ